MADELIIPETNSDFNQYYTGNLDAQSNILSDLAGGAVASVADFGATTFNSLVPEKYEVDTQDFISKFGDNALRVYNEHPDAVQTASFIGGLFVPSGLALKGMGAMRAGAKGTSWFSTERRAADLKHMEELMKAGPSATAEYKALRNSFYARGVANQVADAGAMELAVVMGMNAHPFMEDYLEDPLKNFGLSVAFGGVVGGAIGHIADRFAVKAVEGGLETGAFTKILGEMAPTPEGVPLAGQTHIRQQNISSLEQMIAKGIKSEDGAFTKVDEMTKGFAEKVLLEERALQRRAYDELASRMKQEPEEFQKLVKERIINDPRFAVADSVTTLKVGEKLMPNGRRVVDIAEDFGPLTRVVNRIVGGVKTAVGEAGVTRVFYPELDGFGKVADSAYIGRASALRGVTEQTITRAASFTSKTHLHPAPDAVLELRASSAPVVDRLYLEALSFVNKKSSKDLLKAEVASDDLPMLNAMAAKMLADPEVKTVGVKTLEGTKIFNTADLMQHIAKTKEEAIQTYLAEGRSTLEIAIRTNTPHDTVKAYIGMDKGSTSLVTIGSGTGKGFIHYANAAELGKYLDPANTPLRVSTNIKKLDWAKQQANLDVNAANTMNNQIMENFYRQGSSAPMVKEFTDFMYNPSMQKALDIMRSQVANAVNSKSGNRFITSADFFSRKMGDFGIMASFIGKEVQGLANRTVQRMLEPTTLHLERIAKDPVQLVEINTVFKLNAELERWRIYKDRQFWQMEKQLGADGVEKQVAVPVKFQGKEFKVVSEDVDKVLTHLQTVGRELYDTKSVAHRILGKPAMKDMGFWVPAFNPRNKHIAYVWDTTNDTTRILWGNTADELNSAVEAFRPTVAKEMADKTIEIVYKGDQKAANLIKGRDDALTMKIANIEQYHSGASSPAIVRANADILGEIVGGLEHTVQAQTRQMAEMSLYDVSEQLQRISAVNQRLTAAQPLTDIMKAIHKPKDAAAEMRTMLFGLHDLPDYTAWKWANQSFEAVLGYALDKVGTIYKTLKAPTKGFIKTKADVGNLSGLDYKTVSEQLKEAGVPNPYEIFGKEAEAIWEVAKNTQSKNLASRLINVSNAVGATAALRFGEVAQPLVNAMSLPILTMSAIADKQAATFLGVQLRAGQKITLAGAMHDGIRAMNSDTFKHLEKQWADAGYFDAIVSEASKVLKMPRALEQGAVASLEKALDSQFVTMMSKGADYSETLVRKTSMYTGAMLGKRLYPELGDAGITIFARQFMDRVVGNYHAAQRPVFFQGTLGTAMGLFQTYMLTFAQSMYRHLELRDYKALGKAMLAQSTVFGAGSLPGFPPVSEMIGEHYSDEHTDLQTGVIRAVNEPMAKAILYGLPSSFGPAFYTRGEMNPRVNTPLNMTGLPTVDMLGQTLTTVGRVIQATTVDGEDLPRAMGQAVSLQSVSRPLARVAELATGYSITSKGTTMQSPDEVWTATGVISRIMSTRPTEEAMLRETNHLSTLYGSLDRDHRNNVVGKLRTAIRSGSLEGDKMERIALEYFDNGGTPTGWRSAVNTALGQTNQSFAGPLGDKLKPDNALHHMIDMLDE